MDQVKELVGKVGFIAPRGWRTRTFFRSIPAEELVGQKEPVKRNHFSGFGEKRDLVSFLLRNSYEMDIGARIRTSIYY